MKIFSWNVRGLNGVGRQRVVRCWLQSLGLSVGALLETMYRKIIFEVFWERWLRVGDLIIVIQKLQVEEFGLCGILLCQ